MVSNVKHLLMAAAVMGLLSQAAVAESLTQPDPTSVGGVGTGIEKTRYIDGDGLQLGSRPFSWNEEDGLRDLGDLPKALSEGGAWAIRSSGIIAGYSSTAPYGGAFLWRPDEGMISLGDLPGGERVAAQGLDRAAQHPAGAVPHSAGHPEHEHPHG